VRRAALALALGLAAASAARAQLGDLYGEVWLRVESPAAPETRAELPLVEVSGLAGARALAGQDLVVAIDLSDSTIEPSELDLDGDGETGTTDPIYRDWLRRHPDARDSFLDRIEREDFDDSVLMAELAAARALVNQVDPQAFRVGLVAFSTYAWVVAPVGSSREALVEALDHLRWNFLQDLGSTDFARALRTGAQALAKAPPGPPGRERSILLLSDGALAGGRPRADIERDALAAAREVAAKDLRVLAFALGPEPEEKLDVYRGLAELTGGRFAELARPGDAVAKLRSVDFAEPTELAVVNATTGAPARALRSFPDGSFDALVELAPGANRVRFTARAKSGSTQTAERVVRYDAAAVDPAAKEEKLARLVEDLRRRTAETRLVADMTRPRPPQRREIDLRPERPASRAPVSSPPPWPRRDRRSSER
jgi:hypothetical protein